MKNITKILKTIEQLKLQVLALQKEEGEGSVNNSIGIVVQHCKTPQEAQEQVCRIQQELQEELNALYIKSYSPGVTFDERLKMMGESNLINQKYNEAIQAAFREVNKFGSVLYPQQYQQPTPPANTFLLNMKTKPYVNL